MTAYYNEIEPAAAHVLRALIRDGVIAPGEVDTRSIKEVQSDDLRGFTQVHFFAGGGLWSVAARLAGFPDDRELWTGSCPCQPFSVAGKGAAEDDPRHLWPDFFRLIRACRPSVVMGEQVSGKAGYGWLDGVRSDLEGENYASRGVDIPACAVDAPHIRQRLYWIATDMDDATSTRYGPWRCEPLGATWNAAWRARPERRSGDGFERVANAELPERRTHTERRAHEFDRGDARREETASGCELDRAENGRGVAQGDANGAGQQQHGRAEPIRAQQPSAECSGGIARHAAKPLEHSTSNRRGEGWSEHGVWCGRDAVASASIPNGSFWSDHEWRIGADGKARRVKPGLRLLVDGMAGRVGLLRIGGNGIVPQLAAEVIRAYLETEVSAAA